MSLLNTCPAPKSNDVHTFHQSDIKSNQINVLLLEGENIYIYIEIKFLMRKY